MRGSMGQISAGPLAVCCQARGDCRQVLRQVAGGLAVALCSCAFSAWFVQASVPFFKDGVLNVEVALDEGVDTSSLWGFGPFLLLCATHLHSFSLCAQCVHHLRYERSLELREGAMGRCSTCTSRTLYEDGGLFRSCLGIGPPGLARAS